MIDWKPGTQVVCISPCGMEDPRVPKNFKIEEKRILTVRGFVPAFGWRGVGVQFEEIPQNSGNVVMISYNPACFRPVKPTSIDSFTALLKTPSAEVLAKLRRPWGAA